MAIGVRPTFYEEGDFNSSDDIQKRIIQNKYIYAIDRVHMNGQRYTEEYFVVNGKLRKRDIDVPIMPGTYNFFASKHKLPNPELVLNRNNCKETIITDQTNQEITVHWPMCYHSNDGAINVAEYIFNEILNNSQSEQVKTIARMNDLEGRIAEWKKLSPLQQALNAIPRSMRAEAKLMWASLVGPNKVWDHKPDISGTRGGHHLEEHAVFRPNKEDGTFYQKFYHKYGDHDYYYDVWSNIHYGYVGKSCGFTDDELLNYPGFVQIATDLKSSVQTLDPVYLPKIHDSSVKGLRKFDDIPDQKTIELGITLYIETNGNPKKLTAKMILDRIDELGKKGLLEGNCVKHICSDDDSFTPFLPNKL